jgi:demethylmenaquinone methyltransferase/2-methoxy-6-polyprenyl-1,4-benzoquinol methylase
MNNINTKLLFDNISSQYDFVNDLISLKTHLLIKKCALNLLQIKSNTKILDVCSGSGDFTKIINQTYKDKHIQIIGCDFSKKMLDVAKEKNKNNSFVLADCTNLPFENEYFDYVIIGFGLRNIKNRKKSIQEMSRVLKKHGKLLHLDFGEHNIFSKIFDFLLLLIIKIFNINSQPYKYLIQSKKEFPIPKNLIKEFEGLECTKIKYYLFKIISAQVFEK